MSSDDRQTSAPPAVTVAAAGTAATPVPASDLSMSSTQARRSVAEPEMLAEGLRYLRQRLPELTHLSWQEKHSHARAAALDAEFIASGLQAAAVWPHTKMILERTGGPEDVFMQPYYENMKRAYLRTRQFRKRKKKEAPADS
jgi:hypothetical protein